MSIGDWHWCQCGATDVADLTKKTKNIETIV